VAHVFVGAALSATSIGITFGPEGSAPRTGPADDPP
jgi:hypothetical protein